MKYLNKVLFHIRKYPVKVRDVLIVLLILLMLFLLCRCNKEKTKEMKIKDAVSEVCSFPKQNFKDINDLLARGDLCSEPWFEDIDLFIKRLADQSKELKKNPTKQAKQLYKKQQALHKKLKGFRDKQDEKTIDELEKALKEYQKQARKGC